MKIFKILISLFLFLFIMVLPWGLNSVFSAEHPGTSVGPSKSTVEHPGKAITADFVKKSS